MSQTTIAIAGFTGRFARLITEYLLSKPGITIHGICRDTSKVSSETVSNPHVKLFAADSTDTEALRKALVGASVCICCYLGPNELMVDGQQTLIDACIAENVPRYIASDYSFDYRGLKLGDFPYKDFTLLIRNYLVEKGQAGSRGGIRGVHVLNGAFTEVVFSPFLGMYQAGGENPSTFGYWGTGDEKWDMATLDDAAAFVAEVACDDTATGFLRVRGDSKSIKEMAEIYEKVYGARASLKHLGSLEELKKIMTQAWKENPADAGAWMGLYYNHFMSNGSTRMDGTEHEGYAIKPKSLEEFFVATHREKLPGLMF